jgi:outer membrane lipoprotein-sorting protein
MRRGLRVLIVAAGCLFAGAFEPPLGAEEPKPEMLEAQDVLERMASAYAGCRSYRDSGVVTTVFISTGGTQMSQRRTVVKPFTTAFVRPDRFRFEYRHGDDEDQEIAYIVWRKGREVLTWWYVGRGVEKSKSLNLALAGATGVSGGAAHNVPVLLLPKEVSGWRATDMADAKRIEDGKLGEAECFRIEGRYVEGPETYWIDKKTYLIRRIDERNTFDTFRTEETITYDPVIDEAVADEQLEFRPPKLDPPK